MNFEVKLSGIRFKVQKFQRFTSSYTYIISKHML